MLVKTPLGGWLSHKDKADPKLNTNHVSFLKTSWGVGQKHASAFKAYNNKKKPHELNMSIWNGVTFWSHFHCPSGSECALYSTTPAHLLTLLRRSFTLCVLFTPWKKIKIPTVSNIISWHLRDVIIYLLCCKQGQMLCQMHWQQEAHQKLWRWNHGSGKALI